MQSIDTLLQSFTPLKEERLIMNDKRKHCGIYIVRKVMMIVTIYTLSTSRSYGSQESWLASWQDSRQASRKETQIDIKFSAGCISHPCNVSKFQISWDKVYCYVLAYFALFYLLTVVFNL